MQSLIDRGLDPLGVLIDRAHDKGMDFFASLRMGDWPGLDEEFTLGGGGRGYVHREVREHQLAVLEELATRYQTEGVELDFAAAPGGTSYWLKPEETEEHISLMTEFVGDISRTVRQRPGEPGQVGARVYPTEELNLQAGLDVRTWLAEGLVDYVVPMVYAYFILDCNMKVDWIVEAAHERNTSVYAMLQPYYTEESRRFHSRTHATPAMMRAAAVNFLAQGVDGLYTWFMSWPLGEGERGTLAELGDGELLQERDKHFFLCRKPDKDYIHGYEAHLPVTISIADLGKRYEIPFAIADDPRNRQVQRLSMRIAVTDLVAADRLELQMNGESLAGEICRRRNLRPEDPYGGQWLEFELHEVRPRQGDNILEVTLLERPARLVGDLVIEDVEIEISYGAFPS